MRENTTGDPTPWLQKRTTSTEDVLASRNGDTVTLDGVAGVYGDGPPVEKADTDADGNGGDVLDTDDLAAALRAHADASRPDSLSKAALATDGADAHEKGLDADALDLPLPERGATVSKAEATTADGTGNTEETADGGASAPGPTLDPDDLALTGDGGADPTETDAAPGGEQLRKGIQTTIETILDLLAEDADPEEWASVEREIDRLTDLAADVNPTPEEAETIQTHADRLHTLAEWAI
jgi:hypothetical protein